MKNKYLQIWLTCFMCWSTTTLYGNIVLNGSFETTSPMAANYLHSSYSSGTGSPDYVNYEYYQVWQTTNLQDWNYTGIVNVHDKIHGGMGGHLDQHIDLNGNGEIWQALPALIPGRHYHLSFYQAVHSGLNNVDDASANVYIVGLTSNIKILNYTWTRAGNGFSDWVTTTLEFVAGNENYELRFLATIPVTHQSMGVLIDDVQIVLDPGDECSINNNSTEFTKSYAGPNGGLPYSLYASNIYQCREIHFAHVKKLSTNEIVMAGSIMKNNYMVGDNITDHNRVNGQIINFQLYPEFVMHGVPVIQKLDDEGKMLIMRRLDELMITSGNITLARNADQKRIVAMTVDQSSNTIYLLLTFARAAFDEDESPNYFEIVKLNSDLTLASPNSYLKVTLNAYQNVYPADMLIVGGVLRILATANTSIQGAADQLLMCNVPTSLSNATLTNHKAIDLGVSGNKFSAGKMTLDGSTIYFYFNYNTGSSLQKLMLGIYDVTSTVDQFVRLRSLEAQIGDFFPEGIKFDNISGNKVLIYGSVKLTDPNYNQIHYPAINVVDASLAHLGKAYFKYIPKSNANPAHSERIGEFGSEAYIDDIYFGTNSYIIHTTIQGVMNPAFAYSQTPDLYNMVPGCFSVEKATGNNPWFVLDNKFPSIYNPNIFKLNGRQHYIVPTNNGRQGEEILGNFDEHFFEFSKKGATIRSSDFTSDKFYNMDGQRTLSVLNVTYPSIDGLDCFDGIEIQPKLYNEAYDQMFHYYNTGLQPYLLTVSSTGINPVLTRQKLDVVNSCCNPPYVTQCSDVGDIQVNFNMDCTNNTVILTFSGANVGDITMIQALQNRPGVEPYTYSDVFHTDPNNPLAQLTLTPTNGALQNGDRYCVVIYTENGCIKQFCADLNLEVLSSVESYTYCDTNNPPTYQPDCNAGTYTVTHDGNLTGTYNYPSDSHNLSAGTWEFKSYSASGCLLCVKTITVTYNEPPSPVICNQIFEVPCGTTADPALFFPDPSICPDCDFNGPDVIDQGITIIGPNKYQRVFANSETCASCNFVYEIVEVDIAPPITVVTKECVILHLPFAWPCFSSLPPGTPITVSSQSNPTPPPVVGADYQICCNGSAVAFDVYTFEATLSNGCICRLVVNLDCSAGTPKIKSVSYSMYPNSTTGKLFMDRRSEGLKRIDDILILDISGRVVQTGQFGIGAKSVELDISALTPGIYYARVMNGNSILYTDKVIKN